MLGMAARGVADVPPWEAAAASVSMIVLMAVAMMLPLALPAVQQLIVDSLPWRRRRSIGSFLATYLGVWVAFGVGSVLIAGLWQGRRALTLTAFLAVAAAWQLTPAKRWARDACQLRSAPRSQGMWPTARAANLGLRSGGASVCSCWAMMLAASIATSGRLLWMLGLSAAMSSEALASRQRLATRWVALLLVLAALAYGTTTAGL
jgi:predicted metal-binding membrane protein